MLTRFRRRSLIWPPVRPSPAQESEMTSSKVSSRFTSPARTARGVTSSCSASRTPGTAGRSKSCASFTTPWICGDICLRPGRVEEPFRRRFPCPRLHGSPLTRHAAATGALRARIRRPTSSARSGRGCRISRRPRRRSSCRARATAFEASGTKGFVPDCHRLRRWRRGWSSARAGQRRWRAFRNPAQTLKRKCTTSPSRTTYSLPSSRIFPASFAPCSPPSAT